MESHPKFHNEVGVPIVRIGCREFKCIGDKPPQDHPHIYLNIALRYSASIRAWAHTKLIRRIVLTVTGTELKSSNAASFVMPAAANQPQARHRPAVFDAAPMRLDRGIDDAPTIRQCLHGTNLISPH